MITEAIDRIQQLTRDAERIERAPDYHQTGRYFMWGPDGEASERFEDRLPRSTRHYSTESLGRHVQSELGQHVTQAAAYWNEERLSTELTLAITDGGEEYELRWNHELLLKKHPAYQAVAALTRTQSFSQRGLIKFLRAELNGHVDEAVVEQFRSLKLSTDGATEAVVAKGRESVDKRIQQQVRQSMGTDVPDQVVVTIPVHDLDEVRDHVYDVTILVDTVVTDDGSVAFELTTVLNTLRTAERAALDKVVENFGEALGGVPMYHAVVR